MKRQNSAVTTALRIQSATRMPWYLGKGRSWGAGDILSVPKVKILSKELLFSNCLP